MAELLGEQPIGSEVSSRPALRSYFVGVSFTGTPVNISELSGECWGGGGVTDCWGVGHWRRPARASLVIRDAGASTRGRLATLRGSAPRPSRKRPRGSAQVNLCMGVFFDYGARVILVW